MNGGAIGGMMGAAVTVQLAKGVIPKKKRKSKKKKRK